MSKELVLEKVSHLKGLLNEVSADINSISSATRSMKDVTMDVSDPIVLGLTVFVLAIFVGYYVVWKVTPALHSPLMAVTNAISSVIVVGAVIACAPGEGAAAIFGYVAVLLASINIFGGFMVTQRMLDMFSGKSKGASKTSKEKG